jgi:hypothetical protein
VKRIRHEHEVGGGGRKLRNLVGVARDIVAVAHTAFRQAKARDVEQPAVDIDRRDMRRDPGDLQGEPAVARAKIDDAHAGCDADRGEHARRIGPQGLPPAGGRHFGSFEESRRESLHGATIAPASRELAIGPGQESVAG